MNTNNTVPPDAGSVLPAVLPEDLSTERLELLRHVEDYLTEGWFILPLHTVHEDGTCRCPRARSCVSPGKHPLGALAPHGWKDSTRIAPTVTRWLRRRSDMNIGIVLGLSGLASLDVDPRNGGDESLKLIIERNGPIPQTLKLLTGGGGFQYFFSDPEQQVRKRTPEAGIDLLGRGCHAVAPPSLHRSGLRYEWESWPTPLAPVPDWMRELSR